MAGPYFQKKRWEPSCHQGRIYTLDHLDEFEILVTDSKGIDRHIAVTFSDHCFTRPPQSFDPALVYPDSNRNPGHFCFRRHELSRDLPAHIAIFAAGKVWTVEGENFAAVPVVDETGNEIVYRIIFSLNRVKGLPVHLHMRIESAYPADSASLATFGSVRFKHLVALRMENKRPGRIVSPNRKVPRVF